MKEKDHLIEIEDIKNAKNGILKVTFNDIIKEISTNEPVKAELEFSAFGDFIKVKGKIKSTAILECDLCLEKFEYKSDFEIEELYAKTSLLEEYSQETELKEGQFITELNGANQIDIYDLLYQSVILDFPNKKVCGINCKGGDIFIRDSSPQKDEIDPRLAVFKNITISKKD